MPVSLSPIRFALPVLLVLAGCAAAPTDGSVNDPNEVWNRQVHEFNKDIDTAVLRPLGQAAADLPMEIRMPVVNFAGNAGLPGAVVNGILQADVEGATVNTLRFLVNSTVGVFGLFDPATAIGLTEHETDFGQTLAVWGIPEGAYVEAPFFGPSTQRDSFGRLVDTLINPLDGLVGRPELTGWVLPARIADRLIDRGQLGGTLDSILYDSADSYAQARLIYLQNRRFELGETAADAYLDPYADTYIDPNEALE